ncbi:Alpha/Beta hydrolase protein [Plectosphaerella plurivora]|uniref:Carboxylic ester hydrolase n=1 Tax=Plectosphaerella plurivora TaxID=936078 RepID=A0A9P8V860_9PEZI|nr:Alpha/Beta hydrolase protein [Plectosphaerella plurivora]
MTRSASFLLACAIAIASSPTALAQSADPIVDLGSAGTYRGVIQNDGTVASWKGIPYAEPPVGKLRFMPPRPFSSQNSSSVVDVTTDALRCVQFSGADYGVINNNIVGVKAGPGQEDCLKLWIWKPANATADASLPVMFYIHGGALQYSAAPNNDFSDWVGQSQDFIAVNVGYRLGALGFMAHPELPSANAGLLDQRMALTWVKENIAAFGGNPDEVTIMGQSGGGLAIVSQMVLYDGDSEGLFQKAIPRAIQRSPMFSINELAGRNEKLFEVLNCTSTQTQLACFQDASVPDLVNAYNRLGSYKPTEGPFKNLTYGSFAAFSPTIDGVTLTDSVTRLFKQGKVAEIDVLVGATNDEGANTVSRSITTLEPEQNGIWNLTGPQLETALSLYPINSTFGSYRSEGFFPSAYKAAMQSLSPFGESGITGSERLVARYMSDAVGSCRVWSFHFNAPGVGTNYNGTDYPLGLSSHSADNSYLQNATSVMESFEEKLAQEWRAYLGSFIRTSNPNTQKLATAPEWPHYGALGDYLVSPVRLVPQFAFSSNANLSYPTSTQIEVAPNAQLQRMDWWTADNLLDSIRL